MAIKMIVTDLDNTLLKRDKTISDYTTGIFKQIRERGILTAFATSRSTRASARFRSIITPDINITSGGALATINEKTLFRAAIDTETTNAIIKELKLNKNIKQIAVDTEFLYFNSNVVDKSWAGWIDYSDSIHTDFSEPLQVPDVFKITPRTANGESLLSITAKYPAVDVMNFTGEEWYQIKSRNASKQQAIKEICKNLSISLDEVLAFGDDLNDLEMLRECGTGVAVSNAITECRDVAGFICGDCDDDGVAKWIEEHVL